MSRWSADALRIALAPGEIALARGKRRHTVPAGREAQALLPVLDAALADPVWHSTRVEAVLSQHFVRHVLTPPPGKALSPAEEVMLVRASLSEIYGESAQDWVVRVHSQPPHAGLLGAALDGAFARELDALLARHGFRRIALRPLASLALRRLPRTLDGWWLLAEPGWLSIFGSANGCWQHVAGLPVDTRWHETLPDLLAREQEIAAVPVPRQVWLQTLGMGAIAAPRDAALQWRMQAHTATPGALALLDV